MFIGVEYRSISRFVSLRVTGSFSLLVTAHNISGYVTSIPGSIASVFPCVTSVLPVIFSVVYARSVIKSLRLKR